MLKLRYFLYFLQMFRICKNLDLSKSKMKSIFKIQENFEFHKLFVLRFVSNIYNIGKTRLFLVFVKKK